MKNNFHCPPLFSELEILSVDNFTMCQYYAPCHRKTHLVQNVKIDPLSPPSSFDSLGILLSPKKFNFVACTFIFSHSSITGIFKQQNMCGVRIIVIIISENFFLCFGSRAGHRFSAVIFKYRAIPQVHTYILLLQVHTVC